MKFKNYQLVPKLKLGNSVLEAPASCLAKLELRVPGSQSGDREPAELTLGASFIKTVTRNPQPQLA